MEKIFNDPYYFKKYIKSCCPNTEILHLRSNGKYGYCAIIKVSAFQDCSKLFADCTEWCIAGSEHHWDHYAGSSTNNSQYFIVNFGLKDDEKEKLVGFTINDEGRLIAAHAKDDADLLNGESTNITYSLKNGLILSSSCIDATNPFWQYAKAFGVNRYIKNQLMDKREEREKSLNYLFKKLFC